MNADTTQPFEKLVTLLTHVRRGAFVVALYDRLPIRRKMTAALRHRLPQRVHEVYLSAQQRNPIDLIRALEPKMGEVVCLFDLERAFPESLGYLDLQREVLADMGISVICWVTPFEHRELAQRAPNFYAFRMTLLDVTSAGELPPAERHFIGRTRELRELTKLLRAGGCVVLTGLGGVGKTALAKKVAHAMRSRFVGGTVWVECETKPLLGDILLNAAVAFIGDAARQCRPDEQRKQVDSTLLERACLLVLDNFEVIAEDGDVLRWLTTISAPSSVLIVSRQSVPYLHAPVLRLSELPADDAVELFSQLASDAGWEGADAEAVPRLCKLVGNLPLAIELLASRAAELPLTMLEERVSTYLDALASEKDPARDERHQSIAACFRVSFDRLSEDARTLLTRLCVLPDGAQEDLIASFTGIQAWQQPAAECVRHSLLNLEGKRYRFHPLLRRFALAQLGEAAPEWHRRFVTYFRQLVTDNHDINDLTKLAVLDAEWRNALAAAETAQDLKDWEAVVTLSESLSNFLLLRGVWSEAERLHQRALAAARAAGDRSGEGFALTALGNIYANQGRWAEAEKVYQQSLEIDRELSDRVNEGIALNNLGSVYHQQRQWVKAEECYQGGLAIFREFGDRISGGQTLGKLAQLRADQGDTAGALKWGRQAVGVLKKTEDARGLAEAQELLATWKRQAKEPTTDP